MKKILFLLLVTATPFLFTACKGCTGENSPELPIIVNGELVAGTQFIGTSTVTASNGTTFVDDQARFEVRPAGDSVVIYMHAVKFAAAMPALMMRVPEQHYTATDKTTLKVTAQAVVPEYWVAATGEYLPSERHTMTGIDCTLTNATMTMKFNCMGFAVNYEGKRLHIIYE